MLGLRRDDSLDFESMTFRVPALALLCSFVLGCAASIEQVPKDRPHGVVRLRILHESRDFLYETKVVVDKQPATVVRDGERFRLKPGRHRLELISIAHEYGLGNQFVSQPGQCADPQCKFMIPRTEQRTGLVEVGRSECQQGLDLTVVENSEIIALLQVAADRSCSAQAGPAASSAKGR
jgi:hypothetical protein